MEAGQEQNKSPIAEDNNTIYKTCTYIKSIINMSLKTCDYTFFNGNGGKPRVKQNTNS